MAAKDALIGKQLGDYKITDRIGQGGMARIYKGYDEKLQRYAAVKVFDALGVPDDELEEYRQRFMREARAIARLRHPQIVSVYQTGQFEDHLYIAMMFIEGRDLRYLLKERGVYNTYMSQEEVLRVISDIASGLDHAHREGVIHRDIKPSNIMIMDDGHAILTDFGLALSVPEGTTGTTFGSVHYIAPEQATSSALAVPQSDLYSLGIVLYEMLTGHVPFEDSSPMNVALKHITASPPLLREFRPEISAAVEVMVLRAIDKNPDKRYQTGAEFIQALEQAFGMTDVDEVTRQLDPLPEWFTEPPVVSQLPVPDTPVIADQEVDEGEKTITDPAAVELFPPSQSQQRNPLLIAVALVVVVAFVGVLVLGAAGMLNMNQVLTPSPEADASVTAMSPATAVEATAAVVAAERTETTPEVTVEVAAPIATETPEETESPSPTATMPPSVMPHPTQTAVNGTISQSEGAVRLVYDRQTLVLLNQSDADIDIRGLTFTQTQADGLTLSYLSDRWAGGSRSPGELPPGDCFQIWTFDYQTLEKPDYCGTRHAWRRAADRRGFWLSDVPGAIFKVQVGDILLAECSIRVGECVFDLPDVATDD